MTQKTQLQIIRSRPHPSLRASDNSSSLNSGPWDKKLLEDLKSLATQVSCSVVSNSLQPMDYTVHVILQARILEWGAIPFTKGSSQPTESNPGLPHCRRILYQLSHTGSLRILEWVAYPFSSRCSRPRNRTGVSCIAGGSLSTEPR